MKNPFQHLLILLFPAIAFSQYTKDRYHTKALIAKNAVSSYRIYSIEMQDENQSDSTLSEELFFDIKGNLIKEVEYSLPMWTAYRYDNTDKLIATETCAAIIDQHEIDTFIYENNLLVRTEKRDRTGRMLIFTDYEYKNQQLIKSTSTGYNRTRTALYEYDEKGRVSTETSVPDGSKTIFEYDEAGNLIVFREKGRGGNQEIVDHFKYVNNLRTEATFSSQHNPGAYSSFEYSDTGLILRDQECSLNELGILKCYTDHVYQYTFR